MPEFPALQWLGYGLDMTALNLFDLRAVLESVKRQNRIIDFTEDQRTHTVTIDGVEYILPRSISVSQNASVQSGFVTYPDGSQVARTFTQDAGVASRYLVVTTNNMSYFPLEKYLPSSDQFGFFHYNAGTYLAGLQQYIDFLNETDLVKKISELPQPFTEDAGVVQQYKEFFNSYGSHVVLNTTYGARYLLNVWASNKHDQVNRNISRNITASVRGVNSGGTYDETVFSEPQYHTFNRVSQRTISVSGGHLDLVRDLVFRQPEFPPFQEWTESLTGNATMVSIRAVELWTLLADAGDKVLRDSANSIRDAFLYIISSQGKDEYRTFITFEMDAPWAELGITIPSAVVVAGDADHVSTPPDVLLGPSKFRWGAKGSPKKNGFAVLEITNDGSPIDFYIARGAGTAKVTIAGEVYANDEGSDTKFFRHISVIPSD